MSKEVASFNYNSNVKIAKDKDEKILDYPAHMKIKLDREKIGDNDFSGKFLSSKKYKTEVLIYDDNNDRVNFEEKNAESVISKGCNVIAIIELVYLTINTKVTCKWKLVQLKLFKNESSITNYIILDEDEEEKEPTEVTKKVEEEEEEEEEEEDLIDDLDD